MQLDKHFAASTSLALALFRKIDTNHTRGQPNYKEQLEKCIHVTRASVSSITSEDADISGFKQVGLWRYIF